MVINTGPSLETLAATGTEPNKVSMVETPNPSDHPWFSLGAGSTILSGSLLFGKAMLDEASRCINTYGNVNCVPMETWELARRGLIHISEPFEPILPLFVAAVGTLFGAGLIYYGLRGLYGRLHSN